MTRIVGRLCPSMNAAPHERWSVQRLGRPARAPHRVVRKSPFLKEELPVPPPQDHGSLFADQAWRRLLLPVGSRGGQGQAARRVLRDHIVRVVLPLPMPQESVQGVAAAIPAPDLLRYAVRRRGGTLRGQGPIRRGPAKTAGHPVSIQSLETQNEARPHSVV